MWSDFLEYAVGAYQGEEGGAGNVRERTAEETATDERWECVRAQTSYPGVLTEVTEATEGFM